MIAHRLIFLCWIAFAVYWAIGAFSTKRTVWKQSFIQEAAYRIPLMVGVLLLFWSDSLRHPHVFRGALAALSVPVLPGTAVIHTIAVALCVLGLLGAIWARRTLAENWSGNVTFKENHELVERGPYRFVRHPIYTGMLMMVIGTALSSGRIGAWVGVLFFFVSFIVKLRQEEKVMLSHFPDEYPAYRSRSKALIPYVL